MIRFGGNPGDGPEKDPPTRDDEGLAKCGDDGADVVPPFLPNPSTPALPLIPPPDPMLLAVPVEPDPPNMI